jgi:hypothetical protein
MPVEDEVLKDLKDLDDKSYRMTVSRRRSLSGRIAEAEECEEQVDLGILNSMGRDTRSLLKERLGV